MAWLDRRRLAELHQRGPEHWAVVLEQLETRSLKLVFWNYRLAELPEPISLWLRTRYAPLAGNLLIYSPKLPIGEGVLSLVFAGRYAVSGPPGALLEIEGRTLRSGDEIELAAGPIAIRAGQSLRLHLVPDGVEERIDSRYLKPQPLFDSPYSY
jgi:hypothetical protein